MSVLEEIEAIKQLKYRYLRCLDLKRWDELAETLTPDATSAYGDGRYAFEGRDRILEFLVKALGPHNMVTAHRVHQPEIELDGDASARGIWALDDVVIDTSSEITIRGAAVYEDEYVKQDGAWRIRSTGYRRLYEEVESRKDTPSLRLTASWWAEQQD
ncbi:MAG: nuclear transport factor 2 family protein [Myxococcota bacterium]|nr:nuclear transport factor 2 family protein [Myxococcota bacterium]